MDIKKITSQYFDFHFHQMIVLYQCTRESFILVTNTLRLTS